MNPEKQSFDMITPGILFAQICKSVNTLTIVRFKTESSIVKDSCASYCEKMPLLLHKLIDLNIGVTGKKQIEDIPGSKYTDPSGYLKEFYIYLVKYKHVFASQEEQLIISKILSLITTTKTNLSMNY